MNARRGRDMSHRPDDVVVFLGPSLPLGEARNLLNARYLPPARRGSVHDVLSRDPKMIVLLDGVFHGSPSVWQRELLDALEDGVVVIGGSSMGALRAIELAPFGMIGCGRVYRWYRAGVIDGDDEVALLHSDEDSGFRALSEPLVNIRATMAAAMRTGCITGAQAHKLVEYARRLHYPDRRFAALTHCPAVAEWSADDRRALGEFLRVGRVDVKRADARVALRLAARLAARLSGASPARSAAEVPSSARGLRRPVRTLRAEVPVRGGSVPVSELLRRAREVRPELVETLRSRVAARHFVAAWACSQGIEIPPPSTAFARRWATEHRLDADSTWYRANGLSEMSFRRLLAERAAADWLVRHHDPLAGAGIGVRRSSAVAPTDDFVLAWAIAHGVRTSLPTTDLERRRLCAWALDRGPQFFGLHWHEEQALIEELQMTGEAARLAHAAHEEVRAS